MTARCTHQFVGSVAGPGPDLPRAGSELDSARGAAEVVRVVHLAAEPQRVAVNDGAERRPLRRRLFAKWRGKRQGEAK